MYSRIYAPLRKQVYHSLTELNAAILLELEAYNSQPIKGRNYSRRLQLKRLNGKLFPFTGLTLRVQKQHQATVMKNGHVCLGVDKHYYSVPYRFIGKKLKIMSSTEVYYHYERIALHKRIKSPYNYTTDKDHLTSAHRFVTEWTPDRFLEWATSIREDVRLYILQILDRK